MIDNKTGEIRPQTIQSSTSNMTIHFTSQAQDDGFEIVVEYMLAGRFTKCVYL